MSMGNDVDEKQPLMKVDQVVGGSLLARMSKQPTVAPSQPQMYTWLPVTLPVSMWLVGTTLFGAKAVMSQFPSEGGFKYYCGLSLFFGGVGHVHDVMSVMGLQQSAVVCKNPLFYLVRKDTRDSKTARFLHASLVLLPTATRTLYLAYRYAQSDEVVPDYLKWSLLASVPLQLWLYTAHIRSRERASLGWWLSSSVFNLVHHVFFLGFTLKFGVMEDSLC